MVFIISAGLCQLSLIDNCCVIVPHAYSRLASMMNGWSM